MLECYKRRQDKMNDTTYRTPSNSFTSLVNAEAAKAATEKALSIQSMVDKQKIAITIEDHINDSIEKGKYFACIKIPQFYDYQKLEEVLAELRYFGYAASYCKEGKEFYVIDVEWSIHNNI